MRIIGAGAIQPRRKMVYIGCDADGKRIGIWIRAPKLNSGLGVAKDLPAPAPPQGAVLRDERGRMIKDMQTGIPKREVLRGSPEHLESIRDNEALRTIALLVDCIEPGQIEFDAKREAFSSGKSYWEAISKELMEAGITTAVLDKMIEAADSMADVDQEEFEEANEAIEVKDKSGNSSEPLPTGP